MRRVLLTAMGSIGEVQPLLALALRLRAAGLQVRLCVSAEFHSRVESFGFPVMPIASYPWRQAVPDRGASPQQRRELAEATVADQFSALSAAALDCDVIVAAAVLAEVLPVARSVAELLGIGYVFAAFCPAYLPSPHQPPPRLPAGQAAGADNRELWARQAERMHDRLGGALNRQRELAGLGRVDDVFGHILTSRPWLTADPVLAPWPGQADGSVVQTGAWVLADDRPLPADLEAFLRAGEPPVYFGFSSMPMPAEVAGKLVLAAREAGRRVIISRGGAGLALTAAEPDCLVVGEVNLGALFGRVSAVVHHGGAGTTTLAGLAGVPQVVVPQRFDQPYWAARVTDLGIGAAHAGGVPDADSLAAALSLALAPGVAARAEAVAAAMERSGAQLAADLLATSG